MRETIYTLYAVEHCPQAMLDKYPKPATYADGSLYLFGETLEQVSGTPAELIIDVSAYGFNYPYVEGEAGLTAEQLDAEVDRLLGIMSEGEVHLSKSQGKYLYESRFKPVVTE